jgi:hypothetical protein
VRKKSRIVAARERYRVVECERSLLKLLGGESGGEHRQK